MISQNSLTQPLKWHGGKHYLAKRVIRLMPPHTHYVEPYFGGGSVLLNKDPDNVSEVANDIHGDLTNFWRVLQSPTDFAGFQRIIEAVPFSQTEWEDSKRTVDDGILRAVRFFIRCRQSRAGKFDCFATLSRNRVRRRMNEQASAWMTAIEGLAAVAARLRRVVILNDEAIDVIRQEDGQRTLFYLDPPYVHDTRATAHDYAFEMAIDQHAKLIETIQQCQGKVLLSGYPNELYDRELRHWNHTDFQIDNKASSAKQKRMMTERVWMNF